MAKNQFGQPLPAYGYCTPLSGGRLAISEYGQDRIWFGDYPVRGAGRVDGNGDCASWLMFIKGAVSENGKAHVIGKSHDGVATLVCEDSRLIELGPTYPNYCVLIRAIPGNLLEVAWQPEDLVAYRVTLKADTYQFIGTPERIELDPTKSRGLLQFMDDGSIGLNSPVSVVINGLRVAYRMTVGNTTIGQANEIAGIYIFRGTDKGILFEGESWEPQISQDGKWWACRGSADEKQVNFGPVPAVIRLISSPQPDDRLDLNKELVDVYLEAFVLFAYKLNSEGEGSTPFTPPTRQEIPYDGCVLENKVGVHNVIDKSLGVIAGINDMPAVPADLRFAIRVANDGSGGGDLEEVMRNSRAMSLQMGIPLNLYVDNDDPTAIPWNLYFNSEKDIYELRIYPKPGGSWAKIKSGIDEAVRYLILKKVQFLNLCCRAFDSGLSWGPNELYNLQIRFGQYVRELQVRKKTDSNVPRIVALSFFSYGRDDGKSVGGIRVHLELLEVHKRIKSLIPANVVIQTPVIKDDMANLLTIQITDDQLINRRERFQDCYMSFGRWQKQRIQDNMRDSEYYFKIYCENRERGWDHEHSVQAMLNGMIDEQNGLDHTKILAMPFPGVEVTW